MTPLQRHRLYAYVGPSLAEEEARRLAPRVELLPPICQGDLSTLLEFGEPRAVLIVDGEFGQSLSVWHKEILRAIDEGVRVVGASSMGALRAAELHLFGMEGVGAIFEYYRDGWLTSDADVALLFGDASSGYRPLTWPLVNVRSTVAALVAGGHLGEGLGAATLAAAGQVHFTGRDHESIAEALVAGGTDPAQAELVGELLRTRRVDQKRLDAIAAFEHLGRLDEVPAPPAQPPRYLYGRIFDSLRWTDVHLTRRTGRLRRYQLVNDIALHHPDYRGLLARAADRFLVLGYAHEANITATADGRRRAREELLARHQLSEDTLAAWLQANDIDTEGFDGLVEQLAILARMRNTLLDSRIYERSRRMVIEQLQIEGGYAAAADAAARRRTLADARPTPAYPQSAEEVIELLARQQAVSGWRARPDLATVAYEEGFDSLGGLLVALSDSAAASMTGQERRTRLMRLFGPRDPDAAVPSAAAVAPPGRAAARPPIGGGPAADATHVQALLEAHQVTMAVLAAVELGVPEALHVHPDAPAADLAAVVGARADLLERLLRALAAAGLVAGDGGRWRLTPAGAWLAPQHVDSLDAYARDVLVNGLPAWTGLAGVVRAGAVPSPRDPALADLGIAAATGALEFAPLVLAALDLAHGVRVIDLGGGLGRLAEGFVAARPDLRITVVERPATAERARAYLAERGLAAAVQVRGTDEVTEADGRADVCLLQRVLLNLDDENAVGLLVRAAALVVPEGRVVVVDIEDDRSLGTTLGDLLNLARVGGRVRPRAEWDRLGARARLRLTARRTLRPPFSLMTFEPDAGRRA